MKKFLILLFLILSNVVFIYAQNNIVPSCQIHVDGDLPEDRNGKLKKTIKMNAEFLLQAFENAILTNSDPVLERKSIVDTGMQELLSLWHNKSQMFCQQTEVFATLIKNSSAIKDKKHDCVYELRDIPVYLTEEAELPKSLNVLFNAEGKIVGMTFGLDKEFIRNITDGSQKEGIDLTRKKIVLSFLENFRTAYNRKDIDFLNKVYSDDALIIVGRTVQRKNNDVIALTNSDFKGLATNTVEYVKTSKKDYLSKLNTIFKTSDYVNVDFENVRINRHPDGTRLTENLYCINLVQSWTSERNSGSTYHDDGYLFLLVNFDDQNNPTIQIRTWQEMKKTAPNEIITINNLNNYR